MNDRNRLLDGDSTELERLLLSAVAKERPSRALLRRMRVGLGLAGSLMTFKAALAAASVAVAAAAATVAVLDDTSAPAPAAPVHAVQTRSPALEPTSSRAEPTPGAPAQSESVSAPVVSAAPSGSASAPIVSPKADRRAEDARQSRAPAGDLREEMELLERGRASLRSGDPQRALAHLSEYQRRFPRGVFGQEASVLRIEALQRGGDEVRARALAEAFVKRHPGSPHVDRLSRILGSAKTER